MARPPNYSLERQERDRAKAKKVAEKAAAKREQRERAQSQTPGSAEPAGDS
jgi:hypothetical protein